MITPIIIPMRTREPECPSCRCREDKKHTCRKCGYEYVDNMEFPYWYVSLILTAILIFAIYWAWDLIFESVESWARIPLMVISGALGMFLIAVSWASLARIISISERSK